MTRTGFYLFALCLFFWTPVAAEPAPSVVENVINGKSFVLKNGMTVRLASIQVPNLEEKDGKMRPGEPLGEEAAALLQTLTQGKQVLLTPDPALLDRHGRRVAFAALEDGRLLQEEMVGAGMALVYPFPDHRERLPVLFAAERQAREAKRGIWGHAYWKPAAADTIMAEGERYRLVSGIVKRVATAGGNWYLNFGEDYKTDFTAFVRKEDYHIHFKDFSLKNLEGKPVTLRGWTYRRDGVMMDIALPDQIEAGR